jgi:hypothetical protein
MMNDDVAFGATQYQKLRKLPLNLSESAAYSRNTDELDLILC